LIRRHRFSTAASRRFALSTASGLALVACAAQPAWAQDAATQETDESDETEEPAIVITGYRASLQSASRKTPTRSST
jgi:hypothetical protein